MYHTILPRDIVQAATPQHPPAALTHQFGQATEPPYVISNSSAHDNFAQFPLGSLTPALQYGDAITYTIRITNTSIQTVTNVEIRDSVPLSVGEYISNTISITGSIPGVVGTSNDGSNPNLLWIVDEIPPGQAVEANFAMRAQAFISGTVISNAASVTSSEYITPLVELVTNTVRMPTLDVALGLTDANGAPLSSGDPAVFTLVVTNDSPGTVARNVTVSEVLPEQVRYIPNSLRGGNARNESGFPNVQWTIDELVGASSQALSFSGYIGDDLSNGFEISRSASLQSDDVLEADSNGLPISRTVSAQGVYTVSAVNRLTIIHETNPTDGTNFAYTLRNPNDAIRSFVLDHAVPDDQDPYQQQQTFDSLTPGVYTLSTIAIGGWEPPTVSCDQASVEPAREGFLFTLEAGSDVVCTVASQQPAQLTLLNDVINNNGGTARPGDFTLRVNGEVASIGLPIRVDPAQPLIITQEGPDGYATGAILGSGCPTSLDDPFSIAAGANLICRLTNDDIAPTIALVAEVNNDSGGTALPVEFTLRLDGLPVLSGEPQPTFAGLPIVVRGEGPIGYRVAKIGGALCPAQVDLTEPALPANPASSGTSGAETGTPITLSLDEQAVCVITFDDIAPTVTLQAQVNNDSGGTMTVTDLALLLDGIAVAPNTAQAVSANASIALGVQIPVGYLVSTISGVDCPQTLGELIVLTLAENLVCTITVDDIAPTVTMLGRALNDAGGTVSGDDFTFIINGEQVTAGTAVAVQANQQISVLQPDLLGYEMVGIEGSGCPGTPNGAVTLGLDEHIICTVIKQDIAPSITVTYDFIPANDPSEPDGGDLPTSFTLLINGRTQATGLSGQGETGAFALRAGSQILSVGFDLSGGQDFQALWSGDCDLAGQLDLMLAQAARCSVTVARKGTIRIINETVPQNAAGTFAFSTTVEPLNFALDQSTPEFLLAVEPGTYVISEISALEAFDLTGLICMDGKPTGLPSTIDFAQRTARLQVDLGETVVCRFTHTQRGRIRLKPLTNPSGSAATFAYSGAVDASVTSGQAIVSPYLQPGQYEVTQLTPPQGFHLDNLHCNHGQTGGGQAELGRSDSDSQENDSGDQVSASALIQLSPGADVTCLFVNEYAGVIIDYPNRSQSSRVLSDGIIDASISNTASPNTALVLTEGDGSSTNYSVRLNSRPDLPVKVYIDGDAGLVLSKRLLYFDAQTWFVPQQVTLSVVDDNIDQGRVDKTIRHTVESDDPAYSGSEVRFINNGGVDDGTETRGLQSINVSVIDNDIATIVMNVPANEIGLREGVGTVFRYWIHLSTQPAAEVVLSLQSDNQTTTNRSKIVFDRANWSIPQSVQISAVDDALVEGPHFGAVEHHIVTTDVGYAQPRFEYVDNGSANQGTEGRLGFPIIDNDSSSLQLLPRELNLAEGAITTYELVLTHRPNADVRVAIEQSVSPNSPPDLRSNLSVWPPEITFTSGNWSIPQRVTLSLVANASVEGHQWTQIEHQIDSADTNYAALPMSGLSLLLLDDEEPGIVLSTNVVDVDEAGGEALYSVRLLAVPDGIVTVFVEPSAQLTTDKNILTFTNSDWAIPQQVQVTAKNDDAVEGKHVGSVTHRAISSNPSENGDSSGNLPVSDVTVVIDDNDLAGVLVVPTEQSAQEGGGSASYSVSLLSQPASPVVIRLHADRQVAPRTMELSFTPDNWAVPQTTTILAIDDAEVESTAGETHMGWIKHSVVSFDLNYNGMAVDDVPIAVIDNDMPAIVIAPIELEVSEDGASGRYRVQLSTRPQSTVTVKIEPALTALSQALPNQESDGAQLTTDVDELLFDSLNWDLPQWVTVFAVDDLIDEQPTEPTSTGPTSTEPSTNELRHFSTINHMVHSNDERYNAIEAASVTAGIADNDTANLTLSHSMLSLRELTEVGTALFQANSGQSARYGMALSAKPTATVFVTVAYDGQVLLRVGNAEESADIRKQSTMSGRDNFVTLEFNESNWQIEQLISITTVDDDLSEGNHRSVLRHTTISDDPRYDALPSTELPILIADNDSASIFLDTATVELSEDVQSATYSIMLTRQPIDDVRILVDVDDQLQVNGSASAELTFSTENWNRAQVVLVTATDDALIEGEHQGRIQHRVRSIDSAYHEMNLEQVVALIQDNDEWSDPDIDGAPTVAEDLNRDGDPYNDDTDGDGLPNFVDDDDDGDLFATRVELGRDSDGDLVADYLENNYLDSDSDWVPNYQEAGNVDSDGDGLYNESDPDDDGDGILTKDEDVNGDGKPINDNTDGDALPNYLDPDDDGDTFLTLDEGTGDLDGDGRPNYLDNQSERTNPIGQLFSQFLYLPVVR